MRAKSTCCDAARRLAEFEELLDVMLGAALAAHHEPIHRWGMRGLLSQATREQGRRQGEADALRIAWATLHEQTIAGVGSVG